jgi:hypothetical protein
MVPMAVQLLLGFLLLVGELSVLMTHADCPLPGDFPLMSVRCIFPAEMFLSSDPGILLMVGVLGDTGVWGIEGLGGEEFGCGLGIKGMPWRERGRHMRDREEDSRRGLEGWGIVGEF